MDCIICGNWFSSVIHNGACPTCERAMKQLGLNMMPNRIKELAQAEKDGRLLVLPCKVGDTVYIIHGEVIIVAKVEEIHQWMSGKWQLSVHTDKRYTHWVGYEVCLDDFGKTVFLTREEAEAALKKMEADNEAD